MYQASLDMIADGMEACWRTAVNTVEAASILKSHGHNGLCLSLSVLAMEEIGKLILIDGLLFARPNDERSELYDKCFRAHKSKLLSIDVFPLFLNYLSTLDPRHGKDKAFALAVALCIKQYKEQRLSLAKWIGKECDLQKLDFWKQRGFYTHYTERRFVSPSEIDQVFCESVYLLSYRIVDSVTFLLKNNLIRYKEHIRTSRERLSEKEIIEIRQEAQRCVEDVFGLAVENK
jgi:AbiV family abortive infection protein